MKKIVMTGGGTSGHVTPNIALIPELKALGCHIEYIGSKDGMERQLIEAEGISYHGISAGKLRRYLSMKNISDMFQVLGGLRQSVSLMRRIRPDIVFSKGGFVSCALLSGRPGFAGCRLSSMSPISLPALPTSSPCPLPGRSAIPFPNRESIYLRRREC